MDPTDALAALHHEGGWTADRGGCTQNISGLDHSTNEPYFYVISWTECPNVDDHRAFGAWFIARGVSPAAPVPEGLREALTKFVTGEGAMATDPDGDCYFCEAEGVDAERAPDDDNEDNGGRHEDWCLVSIARAALAATPPAPPAGLDVALRVAWSVARDFDHWRTAEEFIEAVRDRLAASQEGPQPDPEFLERPCPACGAALAAADTHWSLWSDAYECPVAAPSQEGD